MIKAFYIQELEELEDKYKNGIGICPFMQGKE